MTKNKKKLGPIVAHDATIVEETPHSGQEMKTMTLTDVILRVENIEKRLETQGAIIDEIKERLSENDLDFANLFKQFHFLSQRAKFDSPVAEVVAADTPIAVDPQEEQS